MKKCKECGVELVAGENWWPSCIKQYKYICIKCHKAQGRRWREARLDYDYQYHQAHKKKRNANMRQWHAEHREERTEYERQWREENSSKAREHRRCYRARKANATIGEIDDQKIYELYNQTCIYCGATEDLALDHIVSLDEGGPHCEDNLVVACRSCNSSKWARPLEEWLQTQPRAQAWVM